VGKQITEEIAAAVSILRLAPMTERRAVLGFDACIDYIIRIVREKKENEVTAFFSDSTQFGEFLVNLNNKSAGIELQTKLSKIGGNMVITGNALGNLGIRAECIGTFGFPDILPVFRSMSINCSLNTIADTISATAWEFNNSKVIMFDPGPYNNLTWNGIKNIIGSDKLKELISGRQLVAFLNWSEIENSSQIWEGVLDEILPDIKQTGAKPFFFTDFSDCSRKSAAEIHVVIKLLERFRNHFKVHLSLNQNEAKLIGKALGLSEYNSDEEFVRELYSGCNADTVIIHRTNDALAFDGASYESCETFFCTEPKILTGGGDNFNAGFCFALYNELNLFQSLLVANAVAGSYVRTGISPDVDHLIAFLEKSRIDFLKSRRSV
jgi:sugar/nucleoside kinase (ribokinase family)